MVVLINIGITGVLFIISFIITRSFERLAEASQMKSEFINIISHQLRSPITNIKWITDFLTSKDVKITPKKRDEYFTGLKENTSRMVELVDGLLIVARIEQGSFPVKKKPYSLKELVKDLIKRSKAFAEASKVKIDFKTEKKLPNGFFDPALIKLVIENLIDNAIRYTRKGGKVTVSIKKQKGSLLLSVADSGVGIPKLDQKYIFKKFFRAENALKEKTKGSGLGLYIAMSIIKESGGIIWFKSQEGKGTTFYFTLPIK